MSTGMRSTLDAILTRVAGSDDRLPLEGMAMNRDAASEFAFPLAVSSSVTA